jgi:PAS domain S-box-containing protein
MADWRGLLTNLATSGLPEGTDTERLHRVGLINAFAGLGVVFLASFGLPHLLEGRTVAAAALIAGSVMMLGCIAYLRVRKDERGVGTVVTAAAFAVFLDRLHRSPDLYFGYLWSFAFPWVAVFTLGLRRGAMAVGAFWAAAAATIYAPDVSAYTDPFRLRFVAALAGVSLMACYVEFARMRTGQALLASEHRFRSLIENSASVYAVLAADGTVRYESPSLAHVYGYDPAELVGTNIMGLVHPDDRESALEEFARLVQNPGQVRTVETRYRHRDGSWRDIEVSGVSLLHDPAVKGVVLTSHDITARKRAEREVRALNQELEARVSQRTDELRHSEDRLRHSEKMQAIGQLAGGIAHDFNNNLAVIVCCLDMLKLTSASDPRQAEYLRSASLAARRSAELASQLLAFARHESPVAETVDLRAVVGDVVSLLKHTLDKRIRIREQLDEASHVVTGDAGRLHGALLNLAINARDSMPEGGEICFASRRVTLDEPTGRRLDLAPGLYLEVSVTDTGAGMDEATQRRIFEPFFTTKPPGQGTGMGLAAVYGTLRTHRGAVSVESTPGRGSIFRLHLPASEATSTTAERTTPVPQSSRQIVRVLLADDEATVLRTLRLALEQLGHEVIACSDGAAAVEVYRERWHDIDVVVLDMMMPKLGGKDAFLALRQINPGVRALIVSGYSETQEAREALHAGARGFIQKPFRVIDVAKRIAELARS